MLMLPSLLLLFFIEIILFPITLPCLPFRYLLTIFGLSLFFLGKQRNAIHRIMCLNCNSPQSAALHLSRCRARSTNAGRHCQTSGTLFLTSRNLPDEHERRICCCAPGQGTLSPAETSS